MNENERKYAKKLLEEMNVIDNFLFTEIMTDERKGTEFCQMILSLVLKRKIGTISFENQKTVPGVSESTHGVILDTYVREYLDPSGKEKADINVFDIEPDKKDSEKKSLPKRSRYYGDLIDVKLLETNTDYDQLPDLMTIFILSYDPFGAGSMYYEAEAYIKTHPEIPYNDGIRRIYLYVDGELPENADEDDKKLKNLLKYIGNSTEENITDDTVRKLDEMVRDTKADKNVGIRFMKSWEWEKEIRKEEQIKTDAANQKAEEERIRADKAEENLAKAEKDRAKAEKDKAKVEKEKSELEAELTKYKSRFGEIA